MVKTSTKQNNDPNHQHIIQHVKYYHQSPNLSQSQYYKQEYSQNTIKSIQSPISTQSKPIHKINQPYQQHHKQYNQFHHKLRSLDESRFDLPTIDQTSFDLFCCICDRLLFDYQQCRFCQKNYCYNHLKWKSYCATSKDKMCQLEQPNQNQIKTFKNIRIYCENRNKGCKKVDAFSYIFHHEKRCGYQSIECDNPDCRQILIKRDREEHINSPQCLIQCKQCEKWIIYGQYSSNSHNCYLDMMKENKELKKELYHMKIMNQINNKVDDMKL